MSYSYDGPQPRPARPLSLRRRGPIVTTAVIAVCVLVWLAQSLLPGFSSAIALSAAAGAVEPWRFLTSAFAHSTGLLHIASNMIVLWFVGRSLEPLLGHARFAALYLLSALGGGVAFIWYASPTNSSWFTGVVGASGAVFGLFGAVLVLQRLVGQSSRQLLGLLVINAMLAFLVPSIAWQAHLGGLVIGAAAAAVIARAYSHRKPESAWLGLGLILAALVAATAAKYLLVGAW